MATGKKRVLALAFTSILIGLMLLSTAKAEIDIPRPSVPEFTSRYFDNVSLDKKAVLFDIKNQTFNPFYDESGTRISLNYNFRFKKHLEVEWKYYPTELNGDSAFPYFSFGALLNVPWKFEAANSSKTSASITLSILNALRRNVTEGEVDFQVQALAGHYNRVNVNSTALPAVIFHFTGEAGNWSSTQTLTIPYAPVPTVSPSSSPSSLISPKPSITAQPSVEPTLVPSFTPKESSGFLGTNLPTEYGYSLIAVVVVAIAALTLIMLRKRHSRQRAT
jgi:hypothetical protein